MMRRNVLLLLLVVLCAVPTSFAGEDFGVGVKAGTLGIGVDGTWKVNDWFAVRGTLNQYDYSRRMTESDNTYDGTLKLGAFGVLADFFPAKGNFRLTAGLAKNRNKIELVDKPTAGTTVDIGDTTYDASVVGTLRGSVGFNSTAPYVGIGYGNAARGPGRVRFVLDVGVLLQGSGKVSLAASGTGVSAADLRKEESKVEDDIKNFKIWPVIALGISFRI
jgi:hypothetical protein